MATSKPSPKPTQKAPGPNEAGYRRVQSKGAYDQFNAQNALGAKLLARDAAAKNKSKPRAKGAPSSGIGGHKGK